MDTEIACFFVGRNYPDDEPFKANLAKDRIEYKRK